MAEGTGTMPFVGIVGGTAFLLTSALLYGTSLIVSTIRGPRGDNGDTIVGPPGMTGESGETGEAGPPGPDSDVIGVQGPVGLSGALGKDGEPGLPGEMGTASTVQGSMGGAGLPGSMGEAGRPGVQGLSGAMGGPTVEVNGIPLQSSTPVNFKAIAPVAISNPSAGNVKFETTGPVGPVTAFTTGQGSPPRNETGVITLRGGNNITVTDGPPPGTFIIALNDPLLLPGNERITTFLRIGSLLVPVNTTAGDLSLLRAAIGPNAGAFGATAGEYVQVKGDMSDTSAGTFYGATSQIAASPTGTSTATTTGNVHTMQTQNNSTVNYTGSIIGEVGSGIHSGSGNITHLIGHSVQTQVAGNAFGTFGVLTVSIAAGGSGYNVGDILTILGGSNNATWQVTAVGSSPPGNVTAVTRVTPGSNYNPLANPYSTSTSGSGTGAQLTILIRSTGTITSAIALQPQALNALGSFTTGSILRAAGVEVLDNDVGAGPLTINTAVGGDIQSLTQAISNNIGVRIFAPTGTAPNRFGLQFAGPSLTTAASGINWANPGTAADTSLYRLAAGLLFTAISQSSRHYICNSAVPTRAIGPGAGTGAGLAVTILAGSSDHGLQLTVSTGASVVSAANAIIATITFAVPFPSVSSVVFSPRSLTAAALAGNQQIWMNRPTGGSPNATGTMFTVNSGSTALAASTTYIWNIAVKAGAN